MSNLVMTPAVSTIRVYDQSGGYEKRAPYVGIVTVMHETDKVVYLCGASGRFDREARARVLALLQEQGVTTVRLERHGRMKTIELPAVAGESKKPNINT